MQLPSFIFNAQNDTPEAVARRRALAEAMLARGTTGVASNVGEGLAQLGQAISGRIGVNRADGIAAKRKAAAYGMLGPAFAPMAPAAVPDAPLAGGAGNDTLAGGTGGDALAPASNRSIIGYSRAGEPSPPAGWLNYANQGATRNQPLNPKLAKALSFLPEMGVNMDVFSGGQDAVGPRRTGSTRHNHGNSADVFFRKDGRKLDWNNPKDTPIFQEIVRKARANGVTGFGAGPGYMQQGSMHLGFGTPAVWGAGGRGANAPGWLRAAYNGGGSPAPAMAPAAAPSVVPPASPVGSELMAMAPPSTPPAQAPQMAQQAPTVVPASAPPPMATQAPASPQAPMSAYQRVMMQSLGKEAGGLQAPPNRAQMAAVMGQGGQPSGGGILNSIFGGGSAPAPAPAVSPFAAPQSPTSAPTPAPAGDKLGQLQSFIAGPDFAWLEPAQQRFVMDEYERERALANPDPVKPIEVGGRLVNPQTGQVVYEPPSAPKEPIKVGDTLLDPNTYKPLYAPAEKAPAKPAAIQEYEYAKSQGFKGSFQDWEASKKGGMSLQMNPDGSVSFQQGGNIKPMTEAQSKDTVYATRAEGALKTFEPVANSMSELSSTMLGKVPGVGNYMKSEGYQKAEQAGREFLAAVLRKDTGAAITSQEMTEYGSVYFPAPGDSADTLTQKKASRARALAAMKAGMTPQAILAQEKALSATQPQTSITPAPATPEAPAQQQSVAPPPDAIQMLKADPSWEAVRDFNEIFGPGAAERILQEDANGRK